MCADLSIGPQNVSAERYARFLTRVDKNLGVISLTVIRSIQILDTELEGLEEIYDQYGTSRGIRM